MRLYLDDDICGDALVKALRKAGHDVRIPADAGLSGHSDALHLAFAIRESRILLSRNYKDYEDLDNLIKVAVGSHPGILVIRRDNAEKRNMQPHDIVHAIRNLERAEVQITNEYTILNVWQ